MNPRPQVLTVHQQHRQNQYQQQQSPYNNNYYYDYYSQWYNQPTRTCFCTPYSNGNRPGTYYYTASQTKGGRCAFWPICQDDRGGVRHELCKTYGTNGTKTAPSSTELSFQKRLHTWSDYEKKKNCFWYPFCGKALDCGGKTRDLCSKFGKGHIPPCSVEELKKRRPLQRLRQGGRRSRSY